jgi:glycoprotein-N-acetylgalactosamine 3-beta-galactosyltransferase
MNKVRIKINKNAGVSRISIKYEQKLADKLFNEVKILCWVFTIPSNHKSKVVHIRNIWGHKCNKLIFMSNQTDPNYPDIVAINSPYGRHHFWNKTIEVMQYVYDNYIDDYDWFMKADDDK